VSSNRASSSIHHLAREDAMSTHHAHAGQDAHMPAAHAAHEHTGHEHAGHGHAGHGHAGHGAAMHGPGASALAEHALAYALAEPDPGCAVVRIELEAREADREFVPGRVTRVWAYDGQVPGPVIHANVGDVLEVRLTNRLAEPTTIHWHGLRLPAPMDGTDMVQHPVEPGASFTYRFRLPDAGTFWYHSHSNETVQMERGLYGALVVHGADEPTLDRERVLVLDDVTLAGTGEVAAPGGARERHDGREGDVRLVNGVAEPELMIWGGQVERWRVVNAASARYVRLSIGGRPFRVLGTGGGLLEAPVTMTEVLLTPGERVDLAVGPFAVGDVLAITSEPYDRGTGATAAQRFATLRVGPAAPSIAAVPERLRTIAPLVDDAAVATREVRLGAGHGHDHTVQFLINETQHFRDAVVTVGEVQVWDLVNTSALDHPFHLHGFFFQVLERDGVAPAYRSWEDTVNVPAGGRVRIAWIADDRPGEWMYHCHILEHHADGMMAHFAVVRAGDPRPG
jgi:FtsP/CotA-like multicopper oxidase with cupredoxin domain